MGDFISDFEELVADLNITDADAVFDLIFSNGDFQGDAKEIDKTIDDLYIESEISKRTSGNYDQVFEQLNGESIKELLRDVFGEETKGRPVSSLAKELELKFRKNEEEESQNVGRLQKEKAVTRDITDNGGDVGKEEIQEHRASSASYKTAKEELSDYDSASDSSTDYDSCNESISSPVSLRKEEDLFPNNLKEINEPKEKVHESVVTKNSTDNEVAFRISMEEKIEEKVVKVETKSKNIEPYFRVRGIFSLRQNETDKIKGTVENKTEGIEEKERTLVQNITENEVFFRNPETIKEETKEIKMTVHTNGNKVHETATDLGKFAPPKRKISDKAIEISKSIMGEPLKPSTSTDSSKVLPLITVPLVPKSRPIRKSTERSPPNEIELKWQEIRRKMERRNAPVGNYHSVYSNN